MVRTKVDTRIEVSGAALSAIAENVQAHELKPIMERHNIGVINPDSWYPAQLWFDMFADIMNKGGATSNLVAIGMAVVDKAKTPPGFENADLPTILGLWNEHYRINHRSPIDIGGIKTEVVNDKHIKVVLSTLYPDDLCYGMTYAYARRTVPKGIPFTVEYDNTETRLDNGGERTVIHVKLD